MKKTLIVIGLVLAAAVLYSLHSANDGVECTVEEVEIVYTTNIVTGEPVLEGRVYPSCAEVAISYREKAGRTPLERHEAGHRLFERLPEVGDTVTVSRRKATMVKWRERHEAYDDL